jgi:glycosyltransferase involved in cell wall biosynthesis
MLYIFDIIINFVLPNNKTMSKKIKLVRITTVPISLRILLKGQLDFMNQKGMDVIAISASENHPSPISVDTSIPHLKFPLTRSITLFTDLYCLIKLTIFLIKHKPAIVHTHTPKAGLIGMLAAYIARVPIKLHTIAGLPLMTASGFKKRLLIFIEKLTYAAADEVLANSSSMKTFMLESKLIGAAKLNMIGKGSSNGFDEFQFNRDNINVAHVEKIKKEINWSRDTFYIVYVSRITIDKGIVELIDAFKIISQKYDKVKLIILGELEEKLYPLPGDTKNQISNHQKITNLGFRPDIQNYLYFANVMLHPSHREGFTNVVLQSAAMGCPIICSSIPGNIDVVTSNDYGYLVDVQNAQSIVDQFENCYNNYEAAKAKATKLKAFVWQNFKRTNMHQLIYEYYLQQLSKKNILIDTK